METLNASKDLWEHRRLQGKMWRCKKWSIQSWNVESELMEDIDQLFTYAYLHNINLPGTKIGQTFYVDQSTQFLIEYLKLIYYWAALSDWLLCWTRCPTSSNIGPSKFMYPEKTRHGIDGFINLISIMLQDLNIYLNLFDCLTKRKEIIVFVVIYGKNM